MSWFREKITGPMGYEYTKTYYPRWGQTRGSLRFRLLVYVAHTLKFIKPLWNYYLKAGRK